MSKKLRSAQSRRTMLVANLTGGSDPSKGPIGNPTKARSTFTYQLIPDIMREGASLSGDACPPTTHMGLLDYTTSPVPVASGGTITLADMNFGSHARLNLGEHTLISNDHFMVADGVAVVAEDITNTAPNGVIGIWKTSGAGGGEGTINYPADVPLSPGSVTLAWTSGAVGKAQADDGEGGFTGDGNFAGSSIDYATGEIVLDTTGVPPDGATTITIDYTPSAVLTNLTSAINALPGYSAVETDNTVAVTGPPGLLGNDILFTAIHLGTVENFTLSPSDDSLGRGEPTLGPPELA